MSQSGNPFEAPKYVSSSSRAYAPAPGAPQQVSGMAVGSLVTGILGLVSAMPSCCCVLILMLSGALSLIAVILGYFGMQECDQGRKSGKGLAVAGLVCGGIGLAFTLLLFVLNMLGVLAGIAGQAAQRNQFNNNF